MTLRIPFGMDRLPRSLSPDDPRLPGVSVGQAALRFNTVPLPQEAMEAATPDHAARVAAMKQHLRSLCGEYAPVRVRFVDAYIDAAAAHIEAHRSDLARDLLRFDGLYTPEDWLWSALRPLPRAWAQSEGGMIGVDFAFWDGKHLLAIDLSGRLQAPDLAVCRLSPDALTAAPDKLLDLLPDSFRHFWVGETLPRSPFRRPLPRGVLGVR